MKKKILSLLATLILVMSLLPSTALADSTVTLEAGRSYRFFNNSGNEYNLSIPVLNTANAYDVATYGNRESDWCSKNNSGSFYVNGGGYADVTMGTASLTCNLPGFITITEIDHPALAQYPLESTGTNYRLSNNTSKTLTVNVGVNEPGKGMSSQESYSFVMYGGKETDTYHNAQNTSGFFYIDAGNYADISGNSSLTLYFPYEWLNNDLKVNTIDHPAVLKYPLKAPSDNYRLSNGNGAGTCIVRVAGPVNKSTLPYSLTIQNGSKIISQEENCSKGEFYLDAGNTAVLSGNGNEDILCVPYEWTTKFLTISDGAGNVLAGPPSASNALTVPTINANEYIYDAIDPSAGIVLPVDELEKVVDSSTASRAVGVMISKMTAEQKSSSTGTDLATLYAETAISKASSKSVDNGEIVINAASVANLALSASQATSAVETALAGGGVTTARYLSKTITLTTDETDIAIQVDPDILTAQIDRIRIETPAYALTLKIADLKDDLTEPLVFKAQELTSGYALKRTSGKTTVKIDLPKVQMTNPVIVSLPRDSGDTTYQAIVKTDGSAVSSKLNPAALTMDGWVNASGTYTVKTNEKSFSDISGKSAEMQKAILYLTSKGIISGTSATEFSPDNSINRQQIAALLMRALGKVDNTATTTFTDVSKSSSLYQAIASSQRHKIINGYSDNTFRGTNVISKSQIVTVSGRVLSSEMNYKAPANTGTYLGKYSDSVPDYAQVMVALATREGLVVYRTDGTFSGDKNMTRGDAAIILYRLFQKIW